MQNILYRESPVVMGIINLSPDSFYSDSRCRDIPDFEKRFTSMIEDGADIIDIGACSTRPGSLPISEEEEWRLLEPVLKICYSKFPKQPISIDTFRSSIVNKAFHTTGPFIVNDISAGEDDIQMLSTTGTLKLPYIAMHKKGTPFNMQQKCQYNNIVKEIKEYFENLIIKAHFHGIETIVLDPGFGFAKNIDQNYHLLANLESLKIRDKNGRKYPLLAGLSRKSMIYKHLSITPKEALPATCALELIALFNGANIIRAHDVKEAVQISKLFNTLNTAKKDEHRNS